MIGSKVLSKWDEWAKILLMELLDWKKTGWFDIDSIYCIGWIYYVIEFLKCDCTYPWINPYTSHPNKYRFNKQKFISLWNIKNKLNWILYLVNYEILVEWQIGDRFRVMEVINLDSNKWITTVWINNEKIGTNLNLSGIKKWRKEELNDKALQQ